MRCDNFRAIIGGRQAGKTLAAQIASVVAQLNDRRAPSAGDTAPVVNVRRDATGRASCSCPPSPAAPDVVL